jgi:hypothetical protein
MRRKLIRLQLPPEDKHNVFINLYLAMDLFSTDFNSSLGKTRREGRRHFIEDGCWGCNNEWKSMFTGESQGEVSNPTVANGKVKLYEHLINFPGRKGLLCNCLEVHR